MTKPGAGPVGRNALSGSQVDARGRRNAQNWTSPAVYAAPLGIDNTGRIAIVKKVPANLVDITVPTARAKMRFIADADEAAPTAAKNAAVINALLAALIDNEYMEMR